MNLQICFVNESTVDSDVGSVGEVTAAGDVDTSNANVIAPGTVVSVHLE